MFAAICGTTQPPVGADETASNEIQSPVGAWGCILYERHSSNDDYVLMRFDPTGATHFARRLGEKFRMWAPVSSWTERRHRLSFEDSRSGRKFEADLRQAGLGGTWKTEASSGGWWCAQLDDAYADLQSIESIDANDVMPPLIVHGSSTPYYPLGAIRQAKEGHAAVCFLVESTGTITTPEFIELSDEVFRETTRRAVLASSYRAWTGKPAVRPGCRTFEFELDPID